MKEKGIDLISLEKKKVLVLIALTLCSSGIFLFCFEDIKWMWEA
jgi:hypothetical protein